MPVLRIGETVSHQVHILKTGCSTHSSAPNRSKVNLEVGVVMFDIVFSDVKNRNELSE